MTTPNYVSGGNVRLPGERIQLTRRRLLVTFGLALFASVIMAVGRTWGGSVLAAALPATQTAHTYVSAMRGNALLMLPFCAFTLAGVICVMVALSGARFNIRLLLRTTRSRFSMVAVVLILGGLYSLLTFQPIVDQTGLTKAYGWLANQHINIEPVTLPAGGAGTLQVETTAGKTKTLTYAITNNQIKLNLP